MIFFRLLIAALVFAVGFCVALPEGIADETTTAKKEQMARLKQERSELLREIEQINQAMEQEQMNHLRYAKQIQTKQQTPNGHENSLQEQSSQAKKSSRLPLSPPRNALELAYEQHTERLKEMENRQIDLEEQQQALLLDIQALQNQIEADETNEPNAEESPYVSASEKIKEYQQAIQQKMDGYASLYGYTTSSENTLQQAMQRQGVQWAQRYVKSWGSWHYLDWTRARDHFYKPHLQKLNISLAQIQKSQHVSESDMEYLEAGMSQLDNIDVELGMVMEKMIEESAQKAKLMDRQNEARQQSMQAESATANAYLKRINQEIAQHGNRQQQTKQFFNHLKSRQAFSAIDAQERVATTDASPEPEEDLVTEVLLLPAR